jgi:uncharacterized protein YcaQ
LRYKNPVNASMKTFPLAAARALALHVQGLGLPNLRRQPTSEAILAGVQQLGCVQVDTLQMVARSHYLVLWSRLNAYDPPLFDDLIFSDNRQLFEGWQHAACVIPLKDYRYQMPHMRKLREHPNAWWVDWLSKAEHQQMLTRIRQRAQSGDPMQAADFPEPQRKRGSWWDWGIAKTGLEYLRAIGELMLDSRVNFVIRYRRASQVLPHWVNTEEPSAEGCDRYWIEQASQALAIFLPAHACEYAYMKKERGLPHVLALQKAGFLSEVQISCADKKIRTMLVHRTHLLTLEQAADGMLPARRTTFLSPFDNLFWGMGRDRLFWNFRNVLEAYKPTAQRQWGYYCLPILHRDRLVGRFDPKLERSTGHLRLKSLWLEPGIRPSETLVQGTARALLDFLRFHRAERLTIEKSDPPEFKQKLMRAL